MPRVAIVLVLMLATLAARPGEARADDELNYLIGPVFGIRIGGPDEGGRGIYGIEGGIGWGPERLNLGLTRRMDKSFAYAELDPWYIVGGSFGFGIDSDDKTWPIIGLWEGIPLVYPDCDGAGLHDAVTLSGGYRWTGVHELYVTIKAGKAPDFCFD